MDIQARCSVLGGACLRRLKNTSDCNASSTGAHYWQSSSHSQVAFFFLHASIAKKNKNKIKQQNKNPRVGGVEEIWINTEKKTRQKQKTKQQKPNKPQIRQWDVSAAEWVQTLHFLQQKGIKYLHSALNIAYVYLPSTLCMISDNVCNCIEWRSHTYISLHSCLHEYCGRSSWSWIWLSISRRCYALG